MIGRSLIAAAILAAGVGCVAAVRQETVVLSLQDIDCQDCGDLVVKALEKQEGVKQAKFDRLKAEIAVQFLPDLILPEAMATLSKEIGYTVVIGADKGRYLPDADFPPGSDVRWLTHSGQRVDLVGNVVPGKVTVFDFYAKWCGPCREIDKTMAQILMANPKVALRKIDVVDWNSPVVKQHLVGIEGIPYLVIYGPSGKRAETITGIELDRLRKAISTAEGS